MRRWRSGSTSDGAADRNERALRHEIEVRQAAEQAYRARAIPARHAAGHFAGQYLLQGPRQPFPADRAGDGGAVRTGGPVPHAIGKTDFDFFTDTHAVQARQDEVQLMESGEAVIRLEEQETWPDGHVTWVETTKLPLRNDQGELVGTFGISRDITDRKRSGDRPAARPRRQPTRRVEPRASSSRT